MVVRTCIAWERPCYRHDRGHGDGEVREVDRPWSYVHV